MKLTVGQRASLTAAHAAADTDLRMGSLQALRWEHVDWSETLLNLPTSKGKKALRPL